MKKVKITAEGDFSQPSIKHHSFAEVFLVSLIINLMWAERQDFEINKPVFVERSTQYISFSSRKQPANTGIESKQFTKNASEALQQTKLMHAHTKCPPVPIRAKQLSVAATARVIWLCACVRYRPGRGLVYVCPWP